ncbi:MAG: response regulator [Pseudomonadota bacterium]
MKPFIRVLHLEDDRADAELVQAMLAEAGLVCRITLAQTRDEFETALRNGGTDIIIADYRLPAYDGLSALKLSRQLNPDIPFIFVSGTMGEEVAIEGLTQGATDYVLKQNLSRLVSAVKRALQEARNARARKQAEESLRKLSRAVEQSPTSIIITDTAGNIEYTNPKFMEVTGYTKNEVLGKNPRFLQSGEMSKEVYHQMWATITSGKIWQGEFYNRKKNGELYWESASISPIFDASHTITHFVAVKEDISERKRLENQLHQAQKMESIGRLAGGIAHDFNNVLAVIKGYTELIMDKMDADQPFYEELQEIKIATERSVALIGQLLAFARKQSVTSRTLDLNKIVKGTLKMLHRMIGEDIDLEWLPESDVWPVKIAPSQMEQILANLCVNARDAIAGVGKISIKTGNITFDEVYCNSHPGYLPGEYALVAVNDDGHGMDKETMDKIFEPFFTTKEVGKGTGLGLSTVYGIVKQNNGFIDVYSKPKLGTTFRIFLPHHTSAEEQHQTEIVTPLDLVGHETVLLVEDDILTLKMGKKMLERFGYRVLTASSSEEAIRVAGKHTGEIHLLLTDVIMPKMSGLDLAEKILSFRPGLITLFMSGYSGNVIGKHSVLGKAEYFIQKPLSMRDLAARLRQALNSKSHSDNATYFNSDNEKIYEKL